MGGESNDNQQPNQDLIDILVPGETFQPTQDDVVYLENVNDPTSVVVPITRDIFDRMWDSELRTKKSLKIGWLNVSFKIIMTLNLY